MKNLSFALFAMLLSVPALAGELVTEPVERNLGVVENLRVDDMLVFRSGLELKRLDDGNVASKKFENSSCRLNMHTQTDRIRLTKALEWKITSRVEGEFKGVKEIQLMLKSEGHSGDAWLICRKGADLGFLSEDVDFRLVPDQVTVEQIRNEEAQPAKFDKGIDI